MTYKATDIATIARNLKARRDRLVNRRDATSDALAGLREADLGEQAIQIEGDEVLELLERADQDEIDAISAALKRIETGRYGVCTLCGEPIEESRILAIPETPFCRACAMQDQDIFDNVPV
jgi:RNA polymerase-binding transcription factor DksA